MVQRDFPGSGTCTKGEADFTNDLTGLIPGTEYTYKSYDVDGCGDTHESASATFTTGGVSLNNLVAVPNSLSACLVGVQNGDPIGCATGFTTGTATNGYTLHSVTAMFRAGTGNPTGLIVTLHEADTTNPNPIKPSSTVVPNTTFSGASPGISSYSTRIYTCSGDGCQLGAGKTYFVAMSTSDTTGTHYYEFEINIDAPSGTPIPSDNG